MGPVVLAVLVEPTGGRLGRTGRLGLPLFLAGLLLGGLGQVEVVLSVGHLPLEVGGGSVDEDDVAGQVQQVGRRREDPLGDLGQRRQQEVHRRIGRLIVELGTADQGHPLLGPLHRGQLRRRLQTTLGDEGETDPLNRVGIDAAAHRGALAAGGRTIAVLGSGVLNIYPPEHATLASEIMARGAVVGEAPVRSAPLSGAFPQRNRLISGMSLGVVIVEAALHSGALITARHAMEQGREVFAVPGPVDSRMSRGCHQLIRDGAKLVETADDVLEELGPLVAAAPREDGSVVHHPAELLLNEAEQRILSAVGTSATAIDQVIADSGLPTPQVLSTLSVLEMRRLVKRLSGNYVLRVS
ncbi:MAG: hypothetical protein B7Z73_04180 [Planctomycetia bacterium 21-64-5]|nr:MAG: hypothetical protein B7Z73_04180 [Planctomycetia bacterium 21-64-5]